VVGPDSTGAVANDYYATVFGTVERAAAATATNTNAADFCQTDVFL